jgi:thiol-disulfide isomerase/thioredoxin
MRIIKLYADWCKPCQALEDMMNDANIEHENLNIETLDAEGLTTQYAIRGIPALLIFDDAGNFLRKYVGMFPSKKDLTNFIHGIN